ncbi:MAG: HAD-IIIC family phosphatase [Bdellovibrionales bacterium]
MSDLDSFEARQSIDPLAIPVHQLFALAKRSLKKIASESPSPQQRVHKVAVLGSTTTTYLTTIFHYLLNLRGISVSIFEGEYDSIYSEILDSRSSLFQFKPDSVVLLSSESDLKDFPALFSSAEEIDAWTDDKVETLRNLWSRLEGIQVFQSLFFVPNIRQLGSLECNFPFSRNACVQRLNLRLMTERPPHVLFFDPDFLASRMGKNIWCDEKNYFLNKQAFSFDAIPSLANQLARLYDALLGKGKKCLVLDLDNTLWGGVIGDDGMDGIQLDPHHPVGEAHLFLQNYIKSLKDRGVILAVCSKNEEAIAKSVFEKHPNMILCLDDISSFYANWEDKASNLKKIANDLNIGIDSLVFLDDNPAERDLVRRFLPDVTVIEVGEDPSFYVRSIDESGAFDWCSLTREDLSRSATYASNSERKRLEVNAIDYESYLKSLKLRARIGQVSESDLPRFAQLVNKSNQFNLRTRRYSDAEVRRCHSESEGTRMIQITLEDRFSNFGLISCVILRKLSPSEVFIDTWVMSCRVLKRGVESLMFNEIVRHTRDWGCTKLLAEYIPTSKNPMVKGLLDEMGMSRSDGDSSDTVSYSLEVAEFQKHGHTIEVD